MALHLYITCVILVPMAKVTIMRIQPEHLELVKALQSILREQYGGTFTQSETVAYAISKLTAPQKDLSR